MRKMIRVQSGNKTKTETAVVFPTAKRTHTNKHRFAGNDTLPAGFYPFDPTGWAYVADVTSNARCSTDMRGYTASDCPDYSAPAPSGGGNYSGYVGGGGSFGQSGGGEQSGNTNDISFGGGGDGY